MTKSPFVLLESGDVAGIRQYIQSNPDSINEKTFFAGGTLLHYAAAESTPEAIRVLIELGFDINRKGDTYGDTPLDAACANGKHANAEMLLSLGAGIDVSASYRNPLFGAIIGSSPEIVSLLLKAGIDPKIRYELEDGSFVNAIEFARRRGEVECEMVLSRQA
jgi:ankyrin repeat protein